MFHRIWLSASGEGTPPPSYEQNWTAWQRQYPKAEFKTWSNRDVAAFADASDAIGRAQGMARKADILRYAVLERFGGVYLDCDIEPYHRARGLDAPTEVTVCNEDSSTSYCSIGFIASPPGHPLFRGLLSQINAMALNERPTNIETGPHFFGRHIARHKVRRLPTMSFYPYLYNEPRSAVLNRDLAETIGIHQWGGSWLSPDELGANLAAKVMQSDAAELEQAIARGEIDEASVVAKLSRDLRGVRIAHAEIARLYAGVVGNFDLTPRPCFELLKVAYWLHEQNPDLTVWQIGAADGILVDPIRPFIVKCDPKAVLLEPNPWLFERLQSNYGRNENIQLVRAALSDNDGMLVMNCMVPDEIIARDLPEWAMGVSSAYLDKNALDGRDLPPALHASILACMRQESVETLTVEALRRRTGAGLPDILVVDAEGMDMQIIRAALAHGAKPSLMHFEHCNMTQAEKLELNRLLADDYVSFLFGNDATTIRKDVLIEYCTSIWVEHGIQNIFTPIFERLNPFRH